jgi:hypothetical protein
MSSNYALERSVKRRGGAPQARREILRLRRAGRARARPLNADVRPELEDA